MSCYGGPRSDGAHVLSLSIPPRRRKPCVKMHAVECRQRHASMAESAFRRGRRGQCDGSTINVLVLYMWREMRAERPKGS